MAAVKTSGNTTANPIEDATKKVVELNEEATQKVTALAEQATKQLTEFAEQAKAAQKQQSLAAIDAYEQAVLALADSFEQAANEQPKVEVPNLAYITREITTAYTERGTPARRLTRSSEVLAAAAPFGAAAAFQRSSN